MSPTNYVTEAQLRSNFAYLFGTVAEICELRYGEKPSTKFEEIEIKTVKLASDGFLSDYLVSNLSALYKLNPELLPGKKHTQQWLKNLSSLLHIVIGDLCAEIKELTDEADEHAEQMLLKSLIG